MSDYNQQTVKQGGQMMVAGSRDRDTNSVRLSNDHDVSDYKEHSVISMAIESGQSLLKQFEKYQPEYAQFQITKLQKSNALKLKRYKECIFYGEFLNGKRHGLGIMKYNNGRVYEGSWEGDFKHGQGYQRFLNGSKYEGLYVNGKPEGVGTYKWPNGQIYEGEWINGLKHGSGMWRGARGDSYLGEWKFGKADGYGVHTWVNGDRYEGEFRECLKHGEGTEKFANGDIYIGAYVNGKPSGYGEYYWSNGSFFKGSFKNGLRHGNGVWKRGAGNTDKFEGQYSNDKKCGYGIFTWASGNIYKGNYFDDLRHGYGEMYWNDGSCYKGTWEKGIQHGQGEITLPGQSPKKGIFEENVLVSVIENAKVYKQEEEDQYDQFRPQKLRKSQVPTEVSRISNNNQNMRVVRQSYQHPEQRKIRSNNRFSINNPIILENPVSTKSNQSKRKPQIPLPQGALRSSQQNKGSRGSLDKPHARIPHSSFYLHQINKRPSSRDAVNVTALERSFNNMATSNTTAKELSRNNNFRGRRVLTGVHGNNLNNRMIQLEMKQFVANRINPKR